jgi:hypothetical protein
MTAGSGGADAREGWQFVARWPGGAVTALATATADPRTGAQAVTVAATAAGLHVSEDGGHSWRWVALGPDPTPECLAISPTFGADGTLLLGASGGLFRSTDGGVNWRQVLTGSRVQCLTAVMGVVASGAVLAGTESDGLLRSEDGGVSWIGANAGLLDLNVAAVALSPAFEHDRTAFAGTGSGLFRSRNSGRAWRLVELGPDAPAVQSLAVSPAFADDGLVLAGTEADGLFRSADSGQTWEPASAFPEPCVTSLAFGPGGIAVAGTAAGVAVSVDGGQTWTHEAPDLGPILSLTVNAGGLAAENSRGQSTVLAGTVDQGAARRSLLVPESSGARVGSPDDRGWQPANDGLAGRATVGLAVTMAFGSEPLIGVATLDAGVLLSHDGGAHWKTGHAGLTSLAATSLAFVRQTDGEPALLAAFPDGVYHSNDIEGGWHRLHLRLPASATVSYLTLAGDVTGDAASGPSTVLAAGARCLLLSADAGGSWQALPLPSPTSEVVQVGASPDLHRDGMLYLAVRATRFERDGSLVYAGLELWRTDDLGQHWVRWLHAPDATVMPIAVPAAGHLPASVLVGHPGRVARPLASAVERRHGEVQPLWQHARIGASQETVTALAISPSARRDGIVVAAGGGTAYLSRDGGESFTVWDQGIQTPLVTALSIVALPDGHLEAFALGLGGTLWRQRLP